MEFLMENLVILLPLIFLQLLLVLVALVQLFRQGCKNLNKPVWVLIICFTNMIGPIAFLMFGRNTDD